jgi:hypothetical protein
MLCSFSPAKNGAEETYAGALKITNAVEPLPENITMLWTVRAPLGTRLSPGLLQQSYSTVATVRHNQTAPLVGDQNSEITLHTMSDNKEGHASNENGSVPFLIMGMELELKATTS